MAVLEALLGLFIGLVITIVSFVGILYLRHGRYPRENKSVWKKDGVYYVAKVQWEAGEPGTGFIVEHKVTRHLDFLSYHLIRWIHGDDKLNEMANSREFKK